MIKNKNKYDHLFKNVSPASMSGIHIFGADDDYFKPQKYNDVTNLENRIWEDLFINVIFGIFINLYALSILLDINH